MIIKPSRRFKELANSVIWATLLVIGGCKGPDQKQDAPFHTSMKHIEQISYYDRNGDGKVDREYHRIEGTADADWELLDEDYNGRYEKKILYGIGVIKSKIDLPVPGNVRITPNK